MALPSSDRSKKPDGRTTMELGAVLPRTAEVRGGHLFVGGVDMVSLAHEQGTALYVLDEADMRTRMQNYRQAFLQRYPNSEVAYAAKAFLTMEAARIVADEGLCLDVAGGGELALAQAAGFPLQRVIVHGNNKGEQELDEALAGGVGRIVVDSLTELEHISYLAGKRGITQDVYMRVTPGVEADTHRYIRTGCEDSKFGFSLRDEWAYNCVGKVLKTPHVRLKGLHCHIGSQIFSLGCYPEAIKVMVDFIEQVKKGYNYIIDELDVGGGLGIAYTAQDDPASIEEFAEVVCSALVEACESAGIEKPRLVVEPGRSVVACAGLTLYRVGAVKVLPDIRTYVAVDGGMSDNIRTALYHASYEPTIANKADKKRSEIVTIAGKHCESGDVVVVDMPLQHPEPGDIVAVFGTGAYCYSLASNYNGQPRPAIVFVKDGIARVTTRRETYEDLRARDV